MTAAQRRLIKEELDKRARAKVFVKIDKKGRTITPRLVNFGNRRWAQ